MSKLENKLGLCLSGGGFRAALFHIGTLAALAERELLHKVEVLSTVSGGSIIGAYYYLKVKQLLEGRRPGCPLPTPAIYIDIVREIERDFLASVQKNLRVRLFSNPYKTAKMLLLEKYSRSDRMAELLDKYFYRSIALVDEIRLKDIHITPQSSGRYLKENGQFSLKKYNESELFKIPVLTINATCLNTGHPWEFTGSWVGEPKREAMYAREQNSSSILPQLRFDSRDGGVDSWQIATMSKIRLSDAVAASAAVPGIFPPLPIHDLYRDSGGNEIVVELSDGGVFDNQGQVALLSAQCSHIIVSDASGQLVDERLLSTDVVSVAQRANDVMMGRIRGYGYFDLGMRQEAGRKIPSSDPLRSEICFLQDWAYAHLREVAPNSKALPALPGPGNQDGGMVYRLSCLRTDLDSFSDMEASTLMYHAYTLAQDKLGRFDGDSQRAVPQANPWRFLQIRSILESSGDINQLARHLAAGKQQFFKTFRLAAVRSWLWLLFLLSPLIIFVSYWLYNNWQTPIVIPVPQITGGGVFGYAVLAIIALLPVSVRVREWFKTIPWLRLLKQNPASSAGLMLIGLGVMIVAMSAWVVVFMHLSIFNPLFLKVGKMKI